MFYCVFEFLRFVLTFYLYLVKVIAALQYSFLLYYAWISVPFLCQGISSLHFQKYLGESILSTAELFSDVHSIRFLIIFLQDNTSCAKYYYYMRCGLVGFSRDRLWVAEGNCCCYTCQLSGSPTKGVRSVLSYCWVHCMPAPTFLAL